MTTKQVVLKLSYHDDKARKKVMVTASGHSGVESVSMDSKEMKLTVIGDVDPVCLVSKLRKLCSADIVSVGPPPKPPAPKKEEPKKEEPKKDKPKDEYEAYRDYLLRCPPVYYYVRPVEEDPNACVTC